ncbi:AT-hook motif nuclear-localized protein 28-like [Salvia hispanica]|uniref:AT-hook motif nuclear-localized protein 28-like n=1 Tax=Salvia hispanica TaxID=49212 RepID=UPI002009527F|nr:AT-hook motif nuclear-localized protein 28-like [Salvia hispanica]
MLLHPIIPTLNIHYISHIYSNTYKKVQLKIKMKRKLVEDDTTMFSPTAADYQEATIEVLRRPRGRPPGSKNKPKPPVFVTRDATMSPYVLELPGGVDIVDSTARFCRKRSVGLCLLSANGAVADVTLRQPSATVTFHGRFDILSISATVLPPGATAAGPFAVTVAGPQGQVVGGHVVGPLVSAGTIYLVGVNFTNPSFHRLQPADHESGDRDSPQTNSGSGSGGAVPTSVYSYPPNDVVWAPTTRHQPPPPPY